MPYFSTVIHRMSIFLMHKLSESELEAKILGYYLLKQQPDSSIIDLYKQAMERQLITLDEKDRDILNFILKIPWSIGLIDSGLALLKPLSGVRKKIFIMLAIIEASPNHCNFFFTANRSIFFLFTIVYVGCRSIIKAVLGSILVKCL